MQVRPQRQSRVRLRRRGGVRAGGAVLAAAVLTAAVAGGCGTSERNAAAPGGAGVGSGPCAEGSAEAGAVRVADGTLRWRSCSAEAAWRTVVGADADIVLVQAAGDLTTTIRAHDLATGAVRWSVVPGGTGVKAIVTPAGGPVLAQGIAVFGWSIVASEKTPSGGPGGVIAVDAATGATRWEAPLSGGPGVDGVVALTPTTVLVGGRSLRGLDRQTGGQRWTQDGSGPPFNGGAPYVAVDGELVVLPTSTGLVGLDGATGAVRWRATGAGSALGGPLAVADGVVVAAIGNGPTAQIRAFDANDGRDLWTQPGTPAYGGAWAIGDGIVAVLDPTDRAMVAYELATGKVRWRVDRSGGALGEPQAIIDNHVVALWEADLAVLSTTDGSRRWASKEPFGSPLMNSTLAIGDTVVVAVNSKAWRE